MEAFAIYLLKTSGLIVLFWFFYQILLKKETFFVINRWFLLAGLIFALCTPLFYFTKTVWVEPMVLSYPEVQTGQPIFNNFPKEKSFDWSIVMFATYMAGVLLMTLRFIVQLYSLRKLIDKNKSVKIGPFRLVESKENVAPFSFFQHIIYNPNHYSQDDLLSIIHHEKVHVKQFHSMDVLMAQIILIFQWFNPFMWWYKMAIQQNLEFIADQNVTSLQYSKKDYQYLLLKTSTNAPKFSFTNPFFTSTIKKRIMMLNSKPSNQKSLYKYSLVLPLLVGFVFMFNVKIEAKIKTPSENLVPLEFAQEKIKSRLYTITQNTSENELDKLITQVKTDGGELHIEDIQRNDNGLIVKISVRYDSKSKGGGITTGSSSDENGISNVYFGISNEGGAFITFTKEAIPYIIKGETYYQPMKEGEERNSSFTETDTDGNSVTTHVTRVKKNGKEILYINGKESTEEELNKLGIYSDKPVQKKDTIRVIGYAIPPQLFMTKNTTDDELKSLKQLIQERFGGTFTYSKVKRNGSGEIIQLDIAYKSETEGGASWAFDKNKPIPKIIFKKNEKNGLHIEISNVTKIIGQSGDVTISLYEPVDSTFFEKQKGINASEHLKSNIYVVNPSLFNTFKVKGYPTQLNSSPIYFLDGKEISSFDIIEPNNIESVSVLKGENATSIYGNRAKNGVVLVTSKGKIGFGLLNEKKWKNATENSKISPWKVSYGKAPAVDPRTTSIIDYHKKLDSTEYQKMGKPNFDNALIIINGKKSSKKKLEKLDMDKVESITVIKNSNEAMEKYGKKAKNGVIEIVTKKKN
ncbi:M56 family metallopeptidase [Flagellimonas onchidii]|uniref:M56 family metallopeptidase n=1 Tax=Flagellimonas onchidii TaxID=2562684 RepID=UPI0010A5C028|nr:M56 family metallopeptidase [Allomuricauda onchidii]